MIKSISRRLFVGAGAAVGVQGAFPLAGRAAQAYTLRLNVTTAANSVQALAGLSFAAAVRRRSNDQLNIEVYPNNQLVEELNTGEALIQGVIDLAVVESSSMATLVPDFQIFNMPFLFKDQAVASRVVGGPIGDEMFASLAGKGVLGLCWGSSGFKELETTTRSVVTPEDMKGLRVRIQHSALYAATYQALGAIPVIIDMSEAFVAMTQHTVDAVELPLGSFASGKFYTAAKHVAMTNHILSVTPFVASRKKIEALPAPLQRIVQEEGKAAATYWQSAQVRRQNTADIQTLKNNGVTFTDVHYPAFRKAVEPVYVMMQKSLGGTILDRVTRAIGTG